MVFTLMPAIFLLGIIAIAFEDVIHINKAAIAIGMSIILWLLVLVDGTAIFQEHGSHALDVMINTVPNFAQKTVAQQIYSFLEYSITESLGDVSATLFFVLGSMAIIELIDSHGGFDIIVSSIRTRNDRKLLWIISFLTFFLSAVLGDLATVIVIVAILRKLISSHEDRLIFSCMVIIAANAGGSWSPIGDVTTLLLWTGGNITALHQMSQIIIPGLVMMIVPLLFITFSFSKNSKVKISKAVKPDPYIAKIYPGFKKLLLWTGIISLAAVPFLQSIIGLPPFMGVLLGLAIMWVMTDRLWFKRRNPAIQALRVQRVFSRIDVPTVIFFLGILMSVASLKTAGQLHAMSVFLDKTIPTPEITSVILGLASSLLDNVALVAGTMGMYPVNAAGSFMADGSFWTFLAYCAVTGGSILIIGSASGVTVMGLEKISFGYYLKKFTPLALLGYFAGAGVYLLLF